MAKRMDAAAKYSNRWKPPIIIYALVIIVCMYLGLVIGCNYTEEDTIYSLIDKLSYVFSGNFFDIGIKRGLKQPKILITCIFFSFLIAFVYILIDLSKNRNYMRGKEYGTAKWANIGLINKKFADFKNPSWNRVYSNEVRISMKNDINNNVLVIGGSGVGKSFRFLTPNIYQADANSKYPGSYIFTDPKGELLQKNGKYLKKKGYRIKVVNLVPGMLHESDCFNPFEYIRQPSDIITLIQNIFANTTPKNASTGDPFWEKAESMFLQSLFLIVWMEHELFGWDMNLNTVMDLLNKCEIGDDSADISELDEIFNDLVARTYGQAGKGENHPAYILYKKTMGGAADTKRSIVISANSRLAIFESEEIKRVLSKDELDLASIGTGLVDGNKDVKTALFCIIPDSKTTYNAVAGMLYTLLFQELYYQADFIYQGALPVPVTFWLDEFANIKLPDDFTSYITTMRSRLISCVIIIQNLAQLKSMYEKDWQKIPGNCDVTVYLGGNEQDTFEYISKNLGKKTIYKKTQGQTKGRQGSSSTNEDALGRELLLPEEVRELENEYSIVFVRGQKPVMDYKFKTLQSADFKLSCQLGNYVHSQEKQLNKDELHVTLASQQELAEAYRLGNVIELNLDEHFLNSPEYASLQAICCQNQEDIEKELASRIEIDISDIPLEELLFDERLGLTDDEIIEVTAGIKNGLSDDEVKSYILFGNANRMKSQRLVFEAINARKVVAHG